MEPTLMLGDCLEVLRTLPDNSVDSVVTDPPYGLSFMGKKWDYDVPTSEIWAECLRVLKPGGHLLAFAGTRTQHRMAVRIEDAGFEIRDMIAWVYGSGFPKSLDVSKAIDKAAGHTRATDYEPNYANATFGKGLGGGKHGATSEPPATEAARQWQGWGTALKPALEPITVARKPFSGTVAANVLAHGTGAINVDGCRVGTSDDCARKPALVDDTAAGFGKGLAMGGRGHDQGRWPANLIHDGGEFLGEQARFFYCAKASKRDRDEGLEGFEKHVINVTEGHGRGAVNTSKGGDGLRENRPRANTHPTVKPTDLMRYLCRLVTPPEGTVLDPFMGSGSTGKAAKLEGFQFIGIEREAEYLEIAKARIEGAGL